MTKHERGTLRYPLGVRSTSYASSIARLSVFAFSSHLLCHSEESATKISSAHALAPFRKGQTQTPKGLAGGVNSQDE